MRAENRAAFLAIKVALAIVVIAAILEVVVIIELVQKRREIDELRATVLRQRTED